jgi:hypothetical protein
MKISRKERTQRNHARPEDIDTYRTETDGIRTSRHTAAIASLAHGTLSGRGYLREVSFEALLQCVILLFIEATRTKRPGAGRPACHSTVSGGESNKPLAQ